MILARVNCARHVTGPVSPDLTYMVTVPGHNGDTDVIYPYHLRQLVSHHGVRQTLRNVFYCDIIFLVR